MYLQNKYSCYYYSIVNRAKSRELPKETYTETHHIIPKSLGGDNTKENLVKLTAREHFICHLLLPRMLTGIAKRNMTFAIWSMLNRDHSKQRSRHKVNSHTYQRLNIQVAIASSQLHKGKIVSEATRTKMSNSRKKHSGPNKGKEMSADQKQKLSVAHKGKIIAPETVAKILESRKHYQHSEDTKQKIANSNKGKIVIHTDETKKKISESSKGRSNTWLKGKPAPNRGVPHTAETVKKLKVPKSKYQCLQCNKLVGGKANYNRWHGDNCKVLA
jgi:hypothetical protein